MSKTVREENLPISWRNKCNSFSDEKIDTFLRIKYRCQPYCHAELCLIKFPGEFTDEDVVVSGLSGCLFPYFLKNSLLKVTSWKHMGRREMRSLWQPQTTCTSS